ncbi:hypothetical protein PG996_008308 [Apiospora saccharicola]|uniref:Universal stress protein n=1 Tax=Apiospora saccharicola TaxID=335842 RepID=A0ABR1UXJ3_9PEZI
MSRIRICKGRPTHSVDGIIRGAGGHPPGPLVLVVAGKPDLTWGFIVGPAVVGHPVILAVDPDLAAPAHLALDAAARAADHVEGLGLEVAHLGGPVPHDEAHVREAADAFECPARRVPLLVQGLPVPLVRVARAGLGRRRGDNLVAFGVGPFVEDETQGSAEEEKEGEEEFLI